MSLSSIRARYGPRGIETLDSSAPGGLGTITDDTQMTLFTAEGVLRSTVRYAERNAVGPMAACGWIGTHIPHDGIMWSAYGRWLETQRHGQPNMERSGPRNEWRGWLVQIPSLYAVRAPGRTCLSALGSGNPGSPSEPTNDSNGCGGVMRVAPIGLVPCDDAFAYAAMAAALTHGHPSGYLSAGAYAQLLHEETTRALQRARELAGQPGEPTAERVEMLGGGWVGEEALAIGVYCALVAGGNFLTGVRLAVNHSGDSDSTGSIAGALLGIQCGERGLPQEWLAALELRDVITTVVGDLVTGYGGDETWRMRYPGAA